MRLESGWGLPRGIRGLGGEDSPPISLLQRFNEQDRFRIKALVADDGGAIVKTCNAEAGAVLFAASD